MTIEDDLQHGAEALRNAQESVIIAKAHLANLIAEGSAQGLSDYTIAKETQLSRTTVRQWQGKSG